MKTGRFFALFTLLNQVLRPCDSLVLWSHLCVELLLTRIMQFIQGHRLYRPE